MAMAMAMATTIMTARRLLRRPTASASVLSGSIRALSAGRGNGDDDAELARRATAQAAKWQRQSDRAKLQSVSISIDRSELKRPAPAPPSAKPETPKSRETPLVHVLRTLIEVKGPLTVAEFMQRALSHPEMGYYMKRDVFGRQGDFTTAPEISQMFGELVGVWCVATWQQMGAPAKVQVVELGPGRGSLMSDFLRAARSFPPFYQAIELHMVEISPGKFVCCLVVAAASLWRSLT